MATKTAKRPNRIKLPGRVVIRPAQISLGARKSVLGTRPILDRTTVTVKLPRTKGGS